MHEHDAAVDQHLRMALIDRKRRIEGFERFPKTAEPCQSDAAIDASFEVAFVDGERPVERLERFLVATEMDERYAIADQCVGTILSQRQHLFVCSESFLMALESAQQSAKRAQGGGGSGVCVQRRAGQPQGLHVVALLLPQDSKHVQCPEIIGPNLENRVVKLFGLGQHPQLMKFYSVFRGFRHDRFIVPRC